MEYSILASFLDEQGRLKQYPAKRSKQLAALGYLAGKIALGRDFSERELGARLNEIHTFGDHCLLRRDMCDIGLLVRSKGGESYRRAEIEETES